MTHRAYISKLLGISEQYLSMLLNGKREVSYPIAERLVELFPDRSGMGVSEWRRATPSELEKALKTLKAPDNQEAAA